jgi:protein-tyrosine phosphatase
MIDLHSHLLPAVDDGATSASDTAEMLRIWSDYGFTTVAATHHFSSSESPEEYIGLVEQAVDEASSTIDNSALNVVVGAEIMLGPSLPDLLQRNDRLTLGGSRAVLVEVPFLTWPHYTESVLFDMQLAGFQPVLAHPERYDAVQANEKLAVAVASRGVVLQLTYASLAGALGAAPRRTAERLIDQDLPIILASDAHGPNQRLKAVPEGLRRAEDLVGRDRLRQMTSEIPAALLADQELPRPVRSEPGEGRQSRLGRFRRG